MRAMKILTATSRNCRILWIVCGSSPRRMCTRLGQRSFPTAKRIDDRAKSRCSMTALDIHTYAATRISPMLAAADMEETLAFYASVLGFNEVMKLPDYAILERDGQTIHFMKAASQHVMDCVRGHTEIYIEVAGIQELWEHVKNLSEQISNPRVVRA